MKGLMAFIGFIVAIISIPAWAVMLGVLAKIIALSFNLGWNIL